MRSVRVTIATEARPSRASSLLVPVPPETPDQTLRGFRILGSNKSYDAVDAHGLQCAVVCTDLSGGCEIEMEFDERGRPDVRFYHAAPNAFTTAPPELAQAVKRLASPGGSSRDLIRRIVSFTARLFDYGPKSTTDVPHMSCGLMVGNCIDIHGFLVAALKVAGIDAAYMAGYWVAAGARDADGMHCWVSTFDNGVVDNWDVAQHLIKGSRTVEAALNPIAGTRFAMSIGRGLTFDVRGTRYELSHLVQPIWLLEDGASIKAGCAAEISHPFERSARGGSCRPERDRASAAQRN